MKIRALIAMIAFVAVGAFSGAAFACDGDGHAKKKSDADKVVQKDKSKKDSDDAKCDCGKDKSACDKHKDAKKDDDSKES